MSRKTTRRAFLATGAAAIASLAGCSGNSDGGGGGGGTAAFEDVSIDQDQLVVQLANEDVATVNVIGPDGSPSLGSKDVATGATTVSFDLLQNYSPGEHTVVAVSSEDEELGSTTQKLEPKIELTKILTRYMELEADWEPGHVLGDDVVLVFENVGNAPGRVSYALFNDVPNPAPFRETRQNQLDRINLVTPEGTHKIVVSPGESTRAATGLGVFSIGGDEYTCGDSWTATVTTGFRYTPEQTYEFGVETQEAENSYECEVTIAEQPQST